MISFNLSASFNLWKQLIHKTIINKFYNIVLYLIGNRYTTLITYSYDVVYKALEYLINCIILYYIGNHMHVDIFFNIIVDVKCVV